MKTRLQVANPEHEIAYQDIAALVRRHAEHLTSLEMLAIASNMLGKLVAMQYQRTVTPAMCMALDTVIACTWIWAHTHGAPCFLGSTFTLGAR